MAARVAAPAQSKPKAPAARRRPGRPSKFTPDVRQRILQVVSASGTWKDAADFAGVSARTLEAWRRRGEEAEQAAAEGRPLTPAEEEFLGFLRELSRARAAGKVGALTCFTGAAQTDWRAAEAYLRRLYPDEYGDRLRQSVEHSGHRALDLRRLSDDDLEALAGIVARATPDIG